MQMCAWVSEAVPEIFSLQCLSFSSDFISTVPVLGKGFLGGREKVRWRRREGVTAARGGVVYVVKSH